MQSRHAEGVLRVAFIRICNNEPDEKLWTEALGQQTGSCSRVMRTIVAFGDSITHGYGVPGGCGWVELLPAALKRAHPDESVHVYNAGADGNTSAEGLQRLPAEVLPRLPGLVLVEFGGNDAVHDDQRTVDPDGFERNLCTIHDQITAAGGAIVLLTFPPVVDDWHATRSDPFYHTWGGFDRFVEQYRQRTRDAAERFGCRLFDLDRFLRQQMAESGKEALIASDGVHLTVEANTLVASAVARFLALVPAGVWYPIGKA